MDLLAKRILDLAESETIQMAKLSRELKQAGKDVIDLSLGEPDFETPRHIRTGAKRAIDAGFTHYTPVSGYLDLREAISKKFKTQNKLHFDADQIVVSTGAKQSLANLVMSLVDPGDEVILPMPYWVTYAALVNLAGGKVVAIPSSIKSDFKITPAQLRKAITKKTKAFIFSSPCNPSGTVYTKKELEALATVLSKSKRVIVISDEIYEHIKYNGRHESIGQFKGIKEQTVVVNGVSKGFAMTGWRLGYIGAPKWLAKACDKMQGQITSGTSSISQRAALTALTSSLKPTEKMRESFKKRRDIMLELAKDIPGLKTNLPQGAFYLFPDISYYFGMRLGSYHIKNANDLCMYLLEQANVALVTGRAFGMDGCIRISYAASTLKLKEAMARIKKALAELN